MVDAPEQLRDTATTLAQGRAQLDTVSLLVLAELERRDATTETGAGSAAGWIAVETRQVRRDARSDLKLAQTLDHYPALTTAMAHGQVNKAQARAIVASLDKLPATGGHISASEARRMACTAGIIPVVLGGTSQVLDVGRRRRLHSESMRVAMGVRDDGCTAVGCEAPPGHCHAHHDKPWSAGGPTNVTTGRLLCPHHHRRIHDPRFAVTRLPRGRVSFHRRT